MDPNNFEPPTPDDVRALRARHGLTQVELADVAMVTPRLVQMWEAPTKTLSHRYPSTQAWAIVLHATGECAIQKLRRKAKQGRKS